jgi:DNA-binding CsgD family transcriptional regulator
MSAPERRSDPDVPAAVQPLSRETELRRLRDFFEGTGKPSCLVLVGEPGIGKTTLWEQGLMIAAELGHLVLAASESEAEAGLSFSALADLLDGIDREALSGLPPAQLHPIEVALRRAEGSGSPPDPLAIAVGFLGAVRLLAERQPLVIAVDDVQWLDQSSSDPLLFAARRLAGARVRFLFSRPAGRPTALEAALQHGEVECVELAGLSLGAIGRLLWDQLGLVVTRRGLRELHETCQGNPLFALELGRLLVGRETAEIGTDLPLPGLVEDVFGARVRQIPAPSRRALLAVALSAGLSRGELSRVVDPLALEDALSSGLLVVGRSGLRPSHPLLAATARHLSSAQERRDLHLDLSAAVEDPVLRARHVAMATVDPDAALADTLAAAADRAVEQGAVLVAEELAAKALRLTPPEAPALADRLLVLARRHLDAGDLPRARELLESRLQELPGGRARASAYLLLGEAADRDTEENLLELALAESVGHPDVRATALARRAVITAVGRVARIDEAEGWALEALATARSAGVDEQQSLVALAWARVLGGRPIDELHPSAGLAPGASRYDSSIDRPLAARLAFRGELGKARQLYWRLLAEASARGEIRMSLVVEIQLSELELRAGDVHEARRLHEGLQHWNTLEELGLHADRIGAMLAAVTGAPAEAFRMAKSALEGGELAEWDRIEARRALGLAALFERDFQRAVGSLRLVWEHTRAAHVEDPGAFPAAPDLVEALARSGGGAEARGVTEQLRRAATEQQHPWGLVTADRCEATLRLVSRYDEGAASALVEAAEAYGELGLQFDSARSLLLLGRAQRRFRQQGAARRTLEAAAAQFELNGSAGWAAQARAELARVGGRRSRGEDELTPGELRVAELAAAGSSNKEIAAELFVSIHTVETHLTHIYAKLGVRSRSQIAQRLGGPRP